MGSQSSTLEELAQLKIYSSQNNSHNVSQIFYTFFISHFFHCINPNSNGRHGNLYQCKAQFGTTQNIECRSSQDCSINSSFKCPEHDCLPGRQGRSFCTWQVY